MACNPLRWMMESSGRAGPLINLRHCGSCIDADKHPRIAAWSEVILSRPSMAPWIAKEERMMAKVLGG